MVKVGKQPVMQPNVFDKSRANLDDAANTLKEGAKEMIKDAGKDVRDAGHHAGEAVGHLAGAAANAVFATGALLEGSADAIEAAGHGAAAIGLAGAGAAGWTLEGMASGLRFAAKNVARAMASFANLLTNGLLKDGKTTTVKELAGDPNGVRFSEEMFGKAAEQLNKSAAHMNAAWNSYVECVDHLAGAAGNVAFAAGHTLAVAGNLLEAAGEVGAAGAMKLAELGVRTASLAVEYAEKGVEGARDAAILAAKISAATANALALPDQGKVTVNVEAQIKEFESQIAALAE
jgi:hypothetical protein